MVDVVAVRAGKADVVEQSGMKRLTGRWKTLLVMAL
jgi:hypothetical protein